MNMKYFFILLISLTFHSGFLSAQNGTKTFSLEDIFTKGTFRQAGVNGIQSMNDGIHYTTTETNDSQIVKHEYATGNTLETLFNLRDFPQAGIKSIGEYQFSKNERKLLLTTAPEPIYRRSFTAEFYVCDLTTKSLKRLSENGKQQLATFSPDGSKIAFVRKNNIFIKDLASDKETQITTDGKFNSIINGAPDWVYEEEFSFSKGFEWSPDGKYLAYMRFDESKVPLYSMTRFAGAAPELSENKVYPSVYSFKYPKAGEPNSVLSVHSYELASATTKTMDIGTETDLYIPRIYFTQDPSKLAIMRLNRHQNKLEMLIANPSTGLSKVIYSEGNKYYIDEQQYEGIQFLNDGKHFCLTSERDGWNHIYLYDMDGKMVRQITTGNWDVTDFMGYDATTKRFFYVSAEASPLRRAVYSISLDGKKKTRLTPDEGTNTPAFSTGFNYFINNFSSVTTPKQVTLYDANGKLIRNLENNKILIDKLTDYKYNEKQFFTFTTPIGVVLNGWMIKPSGFDASKKYPVLMIQYSGPNSQQVVDSWGLSWNDYLAQQGFIVACIDPRGTGARGEEFRKMTYLQLGKYETQDQVVAAKYLGSLPYVDKGRIGIWGWSYGGFISCSCMVKGNGVFKAGIAVAPVTNWRFYDNVYTERYMQTPAENPKGYDDNSPLYFAANLQGKFLICHGTADDNVHTQNTYEFTEKLVQANKQFEMQLYTNRNHNIRGGNTTMHLYTRMTEFLKTNLYKL
jgi:dipeptidyl-peptidase-4